MLIDDRDGLTTRLQAADPVRAETAALPDPEGPDGLRILTRARQRARRGRMRRLVVIPAVAAVVMGGATAGGVSLLRNDGHVADASGVECVEPLVDDGVRTHSPEVIKDPVEFCLGSWKAFYDFEPTGDVTACAPADDRELVRVYVGGREVCEAHGEIVYRGPTDEQRRLARFQDALDRELMRPYPEKPRLSEIGAMVEDLLADHDLTNWSVAYGPEDYPSINGWGCFGGGDGWSFCSAYDQPGRTVVIGIKSED
ncbi:hypothetical protein [Streptomyces sp. B6B3]|uniref:hypothetical protein n=1 Tax=Streptomyces sp. B6B3 TaxID=3153570 RepID=UPI00325E1F14